MSGRDRILAVSLAAFFCGVQFYTSLAALSPSPPVGQVFLDRTGATALVVVLACCVVAALVALGPRAEPTAIRTSRRVLLLWLGAAAVASLCGVDPLDSGEVVGFGVLAGLFHLALVRAAPRPGVVRAVCAAYLAVAALACAVAIAMWATHEPATLYALNDRRAAGPFVTANQFGAFLGTEIFVALGVADGARSTGLRALAVAAGSLGIVGLALSFSRGAWAGVAVGACVYLALRGRVRLAVGGAGLLAIVAAVFARHPLHGHDPGGTFSRLGTLRGGERLAELFPLTGSGPMTYFRLFPAFRPVGGGLPGTFEALHPHDVALSLAGELGLVGLACVSLGWILVVRRMHAGWRVAPLAERRLAWGVVAGFVALFVQGLADLVGVVEMVFVWIPFTALGLAVTADRAVTADVAIVRDGTRG